MMRDFNIGGPPTYKGNAGYADIMEIFKAPKDLWMTIRFATNGFTYDCLNNTVAQSSGCSGQEGIDYIFSVTDPTFTNSRYVVRVASPEDISVVNWRTDVRDHRTSAEVSQPNVSDHYGVEAPLKFAINILEL